MPAALLASFWPAFVVYTSWVLTDSLFIDFFTWGLCACVWASKKERPLPLLVAAGIFFGMALLTRPVLMFFPYLLVPAQAYVGQFLETFRQYPPRQKAASFTLDDVMKKLSEPANH